MKNEVGNIMVSKICTAFAPATIGSKVSAEHDMWVALFRAIGGFAFPENGQAKIPLPLSVNKYVSAGVARREGLGVNDYVARMFRGKVSLFARREFAAPVESVYAIVYTAAAYLADPDIEPEEALRLARERATHVLVALLAFAGPEAPYGAGVLVHNIAGGNNEFLPKTAHIWEGNRLGHHTPQAVEHDLALLHRWVELARASEKYGMEWVAVAD